MQKQGILVGFKTTKQGIDRVVPETEDRLDLFLDAAGMRYRCSRVVIETGTTATNIATRKMIGDEQQDAPAIAHAALHVTGKHFTEMWPAKVEHAAEITEGLDDAKRRIRRDRDIDASIHAFQHGNGRRMPGQIALARQPVLRAAKARGIVTRPIEQPVDTLRDWFAVDVHRATSLGSGA